MFSGIFGGLFGGLGSDAIKAGMDQQNLANRYYQDSFGQSALGNSLGGFPSAPPKPKIKVIDMGPKLLEAPKDSK